MSIELPDLDAMIAECKAHGERHGENKGYLEAFIQGRSHGIREGRAVACRQMRAHLNAVERDEP